MQDQIDDLRRRLDQSEEARRRADTIIMQLTQANAALGTRVPELEASPHEEPRESPESAREGEPGTRTPRRPARALRRAHSRARVAGGGD